MRDWFARSKEDSEENRNRKYKEQLLPPISPPSPPHPELRQHTKEEAHQDLRPRPFCRRHRWLTRWQKSYSGAILEIHPVGCQNDFTEMSHWRAFATKLPERHARGSCWLLSAAATVDCSSPEQGRAKNPGKACPASIPEPGNRNFPAAVYLQCPLMAKFQLARGNI